MKVISNLPKKEDLVEILKEYDHRAEWWGGLGDVINHIHWLSCYKDLETIPDGKKSVVIISCHNPHAIELLKWHPKADRMTVIDIGFIESVKNEKWRIENGFSKNCCTHRSSPRESLTFYPSAEDLDIISRIPDISRAIIVAPTAGTPERNIPDEIISSIERDTVSAGLVPIFVGKGYRHRSSSGRVSPTIEKHSLHQGSIDLFGKLSVPGTAALMAKAAGSICTHSSMALLSWHLNKKTFLVYNEFVKKTYVPLGPGGYLFGMPREGNDGAEFSEYSSERYKNFLGRLK